MKILRKNEGLLSNFEVCELLKQRELKRHEQGEHEVDEEEEDVDFDEEFEPLYPTPRAPCETEIRVLKEFKEEGMRVGKDERKELQTFIETIKGMDDESRNVNADQFETGKGKGRLLKRLSSRAMNAW